HACARSAFPTRRSSDLGGHLDVLAELGEELAPPRVDDRLLVLRGGPLGVTCHAANPLSRVRRRSGRTCGAAARHPRSPDGTTWRRRRAHVPRRSYRRPTPHPRSRAPGRLARPPRPTAHG